MYDDVLRLSKLQQEKSSNNARKIPLYFFISFSELIFTKRSCREKSFLFKLIINAQTNFFLFRLLSDEVEALIILRFIKFKVLIFYEACAWLALYGMKKKLLSAFPAFFAIISNPL